MPVQKVMLNDFSPIAVNKNVNTVHRFRSSSEKLCQASLNHLVTNKLEDKMENLTNIFTSPTCIIFANLFILLFGKSKCSLLDFYKLKNTDFCFILRMKYGIPISVITV